MSAIKELLKEIDNLTPIPAVVNQIMAVAQEPGSSMADIAEIIRYDPLITANILRMCNSAYYALPRRVESVQDAVTMMGMDQVIDMVLLKSGAANLTKGQSGYGLHEGELWKHAVSSALISRDLAEKKGSKNKQMIFTAALLKDIGKVILDRFVGDSFSKIDSLVRTKGFSFKEAEKKVIGIDHAELGGRVAEMWDFSEKMVSMIRNHHLNDEAARDDLDTQILYVADNVCMMMGIGGGADGLAYRFHKDVLRKLGITPVDLQEIIASFGSEMKKVEELLKVI
ncbi:MAG: HDOD domain-containing protein [Proteobacteria bacterium]|nr:HDOD domain-containing protein [Pseudomonadota bacterium]